MSNIIQIKHGTYLPGDDVLKPYELGFVEGDSRLIIGANGAPKEIKVNSATSAGFSTTAGYTATADYAHGAGNATQLNGKSADKYATVEDLTKKVNPLKVTEAESADYAATAGNANQATNAGNAKNADYATDAGKLGNRTASDYALKDSVDQINADLKIITQNITVLQQTGALLTVRGTTDSVGFSNGWAGLNFSSGNQRPDNSFSYVSDTTNLGGATGWKILKSGYVLLSASLYIRTNGQKAGVYIYIQRGGTNTETISSWGSLIEGAIHSGVALRYVQAGDIVYVKARAENASASCNPMHPTSGLMILYV